MNNKQTETKSARGLARHLFGRVVCLGALSLICASAPAQNLFMSDGYSGESHTFGHIYKFTPNGASSTFASGLDGPESLAFDAAGNLFVADGGSIYKFAPGGARSTFASGTSGVLAFDAAGNLFVAADAI